MFMSYNGIEFDDIRTITFDQNPIFTEDKTTYLHDEYVIKVHALFNRNLNPNPGNDPWETYKILMGCLSKPRQTLIWSDTLPNSNILTSPATGALTDAKNGPMPGTLSVKQLTPTTWHVEFEIKTWIYNCCNKKTTSPFVSHRWSESVEIDNDFKSKITRKGRIIFRGDKISSTDPNGILLLPDTDSFRNLVFGACPIRPRSERTWAFTVQEDGLGIDYTVTDQEVYAVPLQGLTRFEAEYNVITEKGAIYTEEMTVKVFGDNTATKQTLFAAAAKIMVTRIQQKAVGKGLSQPLQSGKWKEYMHINAVEISVRTFKGNTITAGPNGLQLGAINSPGFVFNPGTGSPAAFDAPFNQVPNPGTRASAGLKLAAAVLNDPCLSALVAQKQLDPVAGTPEPIGRGVTPPVLNPPA